MTTKVGGPPKRLVPWLYIALPLHLLAADLAIFPFFESRVAEPPLTVESLVRTGRQRVGRIRLHEIQATLDTLDDPAFAPEVTKGPSAIVIPCFVEEPGDEPRIAALGKYAQNRLATLSPSDAAHLSALLDSGRVAKGTVNDLVLHIAPNLRAAFPFDHIFMVALPIENEHGTGCTGEGVFGSTVSRLMQLAAADHIVTLVLPAVGYNWQNKHSISFDSLYEPLIAGLPAGGAPKTIVLDLYRNWPTFSIEHAVAAIGSAMDHFLLANPTTHLYRQDTRLLMFLVALCLFASHRKVLLTAKGVAVIVTGYVSLCLSAGALIDLIASGWGYVGRTVVQVLLFTALAWLFPVIVQWSVQQIFPSDRQS